MTDKKTKVSGVKENQRSLNFESASRQAGLVILLFIILLALTGVFSGGYFSAATKDNSNHTLKIAYERFGRLQTESALKITVPGFNAQRYILSIGGDFNTVYEKGAVWPWPDKMYSQGDTLYLVYNSIKNSDDFSVWLNVTPTKPGRVVSFVQLNAGSEIRFWQFVYP